MKNNKFIRSILCVMLAVLILFVAACDSCSCSNDDDSTQDLPKGEHVDNSTETEFYLINNGTTEYKILIPANPSEKITVASEELVAFFKEATGIQLQVVNDGAVDASQKYISIGSTTLLQENGLSADSSFGEDGYKITTVDNNIYLYGYKDSGSLRATYGLLERLFDFDAYYWDTCVVNTGITSKKLMNYDVAEKPDFEVRATGYEVMTANPVWVRRLGQKQMWDIFEDLELDGKYVAKTHNSLLVLDQDVYNDPNVPETYHPKWFMNPKSDYKSNQPCFTAHGDATEYNAMIAEVTKLISKVFIAAKDRPKEEVLRFQWDISDNGQYCSCEGCETKKQEYGQYSGLNIQVCNDISRSISNWLSGDGKEYAREFEVYFLAYLKMENPPVKTNDDGEKYATIRCIDNVVPIVAPSNMDFTSSIYDEINKSTKQNMEEWGLASDNLFLWSYATNFLSYLTMYESFTNLQEWYQFAFKTGYKEIREESQDHQYGGSTGFQNLKVYLHAKLQWNINTDLNELLDKYFANYFGPASETMRELYEENIVYMNSLKNRTDIQYGGTNSMYMESVLSKSFWRIELLFQWWEKAELALQIIEPLRKTDIAKYNTLYDHIVLERLSYLYVLATVFETDLSTEQLKTVRSLVKEDVSRIGLTRATEHGDITDVIKGW